MDHNPAGPRAQDDARAALAALLPQLRAFARFLAGSRAEADDLVQEALLRALRAAEEGRLPVAPDGCGPSLRPWCLSVIRNVFHEQLRARRRETLHRRNGALDAQPLPPPQDGHGTLSDLTQGLAALPPLLREALVLVGAEGLSQEEAAAICGVPVGTMKARVSRARRQLAAAMGREHARP
ncbi:MAG: sigma-70 family RNA polymerase sigma factor [Acetobacteraceae bacterium]|nr:sigma-70 family RNA polymerase sigma factor [Acetobacteraceae bacterium]